MPLTQDKGMMSEVEMNGEKEGEEEASEGRERARARLPVKNRREIECFIPLRYFRRQDWRNHGTCPSDM
jgi:ribonuclease I